MTNTKTESVSKFKEKLRIEIFEIFEKENMDQFDINLKTILIKDMNSDRAEVIPFHLKHTPEDEPVVLVYEKRNRNDDGWCMLDDINSEDLAKIYDMLIEHIGFLKKTEPEKLFNPSVLPIIYAAINSAKQETMITAQDCETILRKAILEFNK